MLRLGLVLFLSSASRWASLGRKAAGVLQAGHWHVRARSARPWGQARLPRPPRARGESIAGSGILGPAPDPASGYLGRKWQNLRAKVGVPVSIVPPLSL